MPIKIDAAAQYKPIRFLDLAFKKLSTLTSIFSILLSALKSSLVA